MKNFRRSTMGGVCAIGAVIVMFFIIIAYFFTPVDQASTSTSYSPAFFSSINKSFVAQEFLYWGLIILALLGIGVVVVVTDRLRDINKDFADWMAILAYIGYGIQILCNILGREYVLRIAPNYASLEPSAQAIINVQGNLFNDWVAFSLIGSWFIAINYMAFRGHCFSKSIVIAGFFTGLGYWLIPLGNIFHTDILISISVASAVVLAPLWYVRIGILLLRKPSISKK